MVNQSITKEAKVYNGETTGSSISGWKNKTLYAKE